jgi:Ca2+-binding RTX toxin-like protein
VQGNTNWTLGDSGLVGARPGRLGLSGVTQAILTGGASSNTLDATGFSGGVVLEGGAGNDVLKAGSGRSILVGGLGRDTLTGGSNEDILISGSTKFDANQEALLALLEEWSRTDLGYSDRIDLLRNGSVLNGALQLNRTTVKDDLFANTLTGGAGQDWFWAKLPPGLADILRDRDLGEVVN